MIPLHDVDAATQDCISLVCEYLDHWRSCLTEIADGVANDLISPLHLDNLDLAEFSHTSRVLTRMVRKEAPAVFGAGFVANPEAFSNSAGLLWMVNARSRERVDRLIVDAEFYDYTSSGWWLAAAGNNGFHVTGPYVDASGTNQYVVTMSTRALRHETEVGVIALDVLVSRIQELLQRVMLRLPTGSCLVDRDGGVIATNTSYLLGANWEPSSQASTFDITGTEWRLVVG